MGVMILEILHKLSLCYGVHDSSSGFEDGEVTAHIYVIVALCPEVSCTNVTDTKMQRVQQEESPIFRENVSFNYLHRYYQTCLYRILYGYGDKDKRKTGLFALPFTVPVQQDASPVHCAGPSLSR
jgi:hypothetical protein